MIKQADKWNKKDYELLDCSDGQRLERWGKYLLVRPDPQVVWSDMKKDAAWRRPDATYKRSSSGGGAWGENKLPEEWQIAYEPLGMKFVIRPMGFKHTGVFPEQASNWETCSALIKNAGRKISVLNLFAYTGGATLACAKAGASVCHVDAAKGMVATARENAALSGLSDAPIRWIVDDCRAFVEREIRRGHTYDAVIMDPPSYGRGPNGQTWKLEDDIHSLIKLVSGVLSDYPLFFLVNSYTAGLSPNTMGYMLSSSLCERYGGSVDAYETGIPVKDSGLVLPSGSSALWINNK